MNIHLSTIYFITSFAAFHTKNVYFTISLLSTLWYLLLNISDFRYINVSIDRRMEIWHTFVRIFLFPLSL